MYLQYFKWRIDPRTTLLYNMTYLDNSVELCTRILKLSLSSSIWRTKLIYSIYKYIYQAEINSSLIKYSNIFLFLRSNIILNNFVTCLFQYYMCCIKWEKTFFFSPPSFYSRGEILFLKYKANEKENI